LTPLGDLDPVRDHIMNRASTSRLTAATARAGILLALLATGAAPVRGVPIDDAAPGPPLGHVGLSQGIAESAGVVRAVRLANCP
jgi:hypothetical protein